MPRRHLSQKKVLIAAAAIGVVVVFAFGVVTLFSKSVLFKTPIADSHCDGSGFTFLNPFRSIEPETASENFLSLMKQGQCERAAENLPLEIRERRCLKEKEYPLISWQLKERDDQGDKKVTLSYCYKGKGAESQERLWVVLEQRGSWQVTDFWRVY